MSHARQWDRSFMLSHSILNSPTTLPFRFTDANTMHELGSNPKSDFKTYAAWRHTVYTPHAIYQHALGRHTKRLRIWYIQHLQQHGKEGSISFLQRSWGSDMWSRHGNIYFNEKADNHMVATLLWVSASYLSTRSPPGFFIPTGSKTLSIFPSMVHQSGQPRPCPWHQHSDEHQILLQPRFFFWILGLYWACPCWAISKILSPHSKINPLSDPAGLFHFLHFLYQ